MSKKCYLILEDGTTFEGKSFGYEKDTLGEAVFNTSMSGYQEILTDPSYKWADSCNDLSNDRELRCK